MLNSRELSSLDSTLERGADYRTVAFPTLYTQMRALVFAEQLLSVRRKIFKTETVSCRSSRCTYACLQNHTPHISNRRPPSRRKRPKRGPPGARWPDLSETGKRAMATSDGKPARLESLTSFDGWFPAVFFWRQIVESVDPSPPAPYSHAPLRVACGVQTVVNCAGTSNCRVAHLLLRFPSHMFRNTFSKLLRSPRLGYTRAELLW